MSLETSAIGKNVVRLCRKNSVKQKELAEAIGTYPQLLSNKIHGSRQFTLRDVSRIADFFEIPVDALISDSTKKRSVTR